MDCNVGPEVPFSLGRAFPEAPETCFEVPATFFCLVEVEALGVGSPVLSSMPNVVNNSRSSSAAKSSSSILDVDAAGDGIGRAIRDRDRMKIN